MNYNCCDNELCITNMSPKCAAFIPFTRICNSAFENPKLLILSRNMQLEKTIKLLPARDFIWQTCDDVPKIPGICKRHRYYPEQQRGGTDPEKRIARCTMLRLILRSISSHNQIRTDEAASWRQSQEMETHFCFIPTRITQKKGISFLNLE